MSKKHSIEDIILYLKIKDSKEYIKALKESKKINKGGKEK